MKTPELKACPCCGGTAAFEGGTHHARVECQQCHLQTGAYLQTHATWQLKYVADIWNKRAGGRAPDADKTAGAKHVGISELLAVAAELEKIAAECGVRQGAENGATAAGWKIAAQSHQLCAKKVRRLAEKATANVESSHAAPDVRHSTGVTD